MKVYFFDIYIPPPCCVFVFLLCWGAFHPPFEIESYIYNNIIKDTTGETQQKKVY